MQRVSHIFLLFSIATISSSLAQLVWQERDPGLSISHHIGDGIRNVPIPPPWYFLKNKYYSNANAGSTTTAASINNVNNGPITNRYSSPDLLSKFNTDPTTAKVIYEPYTTTLKYQIPNAGSYSTTPVTTSTERVTSIPYQPTVSSIVPSTTISSLPYPSPNGIYGSDPALTNAHSRPIYTSEYPYVPEISTETPKLPNITSMGQTSGSIPTSTISPVVEKEDADLSGIETTTLKVVEKEEKDLVSGTETTLQPLIDATSESQTSSSPLLLLGGPQICKKQNSYYGVGENHSFYVECKNYKPELKLCPDNFSFFSNVQWPEYPCKQTPADDQAQTQ